MLLLQAYSQTLTFFVALSYNQSLLTPDQSDRVEVVLVSPRNPLNIGAAARAMANFGLRRLSIVSPFAVNWTEAKSAVGAPELLHEARVFDSLGEAIEHCTLVVGTGSLDRRRPEQRVLTMSQAGAALRSALSTTVYGGQENARVALVFGSEKHGLTASDLAWCHAIAVIETTSQQPSMNLGQAVAVALYELTRIEDGSSPVILFPQTVADSEHLERLAALVEETMEEANYLTRGLRSSNGEALRILLRRLMPNDADLRRMMGLFRRILWRLRHTD